ncbi:MAG: patatin-like phospholipase family protein [bacterium]
MVFNFLFNRKKKVGLVLSGGGARGIAHIGVIKALHDAGIPIDMISGTSAGALVGSILAGGKA